MRYIKKRSAPKELRQWFAGQPIAGGGRINCRYGDMPGEVKDVVRQRLLEEQGWLCCYTGRRVGTKSSHIEHLKPQSRCEGHEDIAYGNLLAAYPGLDERSPYGAHAKADWYDPALMVILSMGSANQDFGLTWVDTLPPPLLVIEVQSKLSFGCASIMAHLQR